MIMNALLIGCDYEGTESELKGCSADVESMRMLLVDKGYETTLLCDDTERNLDNVVALPTRANIINSLEDLCQNQGKLVFFYSGHGTSTRDTSGDEKDGRDEMIVSTDGKHIKDDTLHNYFCTFSKDSIVLMLFDSCNSGTVADLQYHFRVGVNDEVEENDKSIEADILMISGCADNQTSADAYINGTNRGAMTSAFLHVYNETKGDVTVQYFLMLMKQYLAGKYTQTPQITYSHKGSCNKLMNHYV